MKGSRRTAPTSNASDRLAALEMQERALQEQLRSQYGHKRAPKNYLVKKHDPLADNSYFKLFHSNVDDDVIARKCIRDAPKVGVDIVGLKPESAKLYVKYEKVHDAMKAEDEEFIAFRARFLEEQRKIAVAGGFSVTAQKSHHATLQ